MHISQKFVIPSVIRFFSLFFSFQRNFAFLSNDSTTHLLILFNNLVSIIHQQLVETSDDSTIRHEELASSSVNWFIRDAYNLKHARIHFHSLHNSNNPIRFFD